MHRHRPRLGHHGALPSWPHSLGRTRRGCGRSYPSSPREQSPAPPIACARMEGARQHAITTDRADRDEPTHVPPIRTDDLHLFPLRLRHNPVLVYDNVIVVEHLRDQLVLA